MVVGLFQSQYGYLVIQLLLSHLDKHVKDDPQIKTSIITVLFEAVLISAGGSIGRWFATGPPSTEDFQFTGVKTFNK